MNTNQLPPPTSKPRIESIDVLRAFVLFGILLVHLTNGFGFGYIEPTTMTESYIEYFIRLFLNQKCAIAFNILFGVSFYLMLRNPRNSSSKFVWRCFLLMIIGIFNKLFYTYDALMWYGLWGMILVLFRNIKVRNLAIISIALFTINSFLEYIVDLKSIMAQFPQRYYAGVSLQQILQYPITDAIGQYIYAVRTGPFVCLSLMLIGYTIAKSGIIERLDTAMRPMWLIAAWALTLVMQFVAINHLPLLMPYQRLIASVTYSYTVLFLYYRTPLRRGMSVLASYGKLGLTNYSTQGIVMITLLSSTGLNLAEGTIMAVYICGIPLFFIQAVFSHYWLKRYTYGPYEWVWRCCTERRVIPIRRKPAVAAKAC